MMTYLIIIAIIFKLISLSRALSAHIDNSYKRQAYINKALSALKQLIMRNKNKKSKTKKSENNIKTDTYDYIAFIITTLENKYSENSNKVLNELKFRLKELGAKY